MPRPGPDATFGLFPYCDGGSCREGKLENGRPLQALGSPKPEDSMALKAASASTWGILPDIPRDGVNFSLPLEPGMLAIALLSYALGYGGLADNRGVFVVQCLPVLSASPLEVAQQWH
uniref:Uncharacterized protein n=1 Tax=Sphaerodactylus townsendi TaxID=933632 RepID=A0ACB8FNV9_9SAUR